MKNDIILPQIKNFSQNLYFCRKNIFGFRYADIQKMTEIPESTMFFYDSRNVSPYLTVALQLAELFGTTVERLTSYSILFDVEENLAMQISFIHKMGKIDTSSIMDRIAEQIASAEITRGKLLSILRGILKEEIETLCNKDYAFMVKKDPSVIEAFTHNFHNLHSYTNVNYRKMAKVMDVSIGNLSRLEHGAEPMLSSLVKLSDFFDVPMSDLWNENATFDYPTIAENIQNKITLTGYRDMLTPELEREVTRKQNERFIGDEWKPIIQEWISKI